MTGASFGLAFVSGSAPSVDSVSPVVSASEAASFSEAASESVSLGVAVSVESSFLPSGAPLDFAPSPPSGDEGLPVSKVEPPFGPCPVEDPLPDLEFFSFFPPGAPSFPGEGEGGSFTCFNPS